ncbi:MAG: NUDIX domain-containing protein [Candidatus Levyibacteriota bacterium]
MNFTKGVGVFIIKDDHILLLKRRKEPFVDHWEVPAGKVESSETFQETVVREVAEETLLFREF